MKKEFVKAEVQVIKYSFDDVIVTSPNTPPKGYDTNSARYGTTHPVWYKTKSNNGMYEIIDTGYYFSLASQTTGSIYKGAYIWDNYFGYDADTVPGVSGCK